MDNNRKRNGGSSWCWTNERHLRFLNSIEASFVEAMFENNGRSLRLDRHLPDTCESTQDLGKERRRRYSTSDVGHQTVRNEKKSRRTISNDQVVPQHEIGRDEKDHVDAVYLVPDQIF